MSTDTGRLNFPTFAQRALDRARAIFPDGQIELDLAARKIRIVVGEGDDVLRLTLGLSSFYRDYWQHGHLAPALDRLFIPVQESHARYQAGTTHPTWAEVQSQVYPKIERRRTLEASADHPAVIADPFAADDRLGVGFVLDYPTHVQFLFAETLKQLGAEEAAMRAQAYANLRRLAEQTAPECRRVGGVDLCIVDSLDGFAASRLLCPDILLDKLPRALRTRHVIAIPDRDTLLVASSHESAMLPLALAVAQGMQSPYALTTTLFQIRDGRVVRFTGEEGL
jgi:uncharacterized protein YtpQ (UPF0354 family)